jgi:hypothetical protein
MIWSKRRCGLLLNWYRIFKVDTYRLSRIKNDQVTNYIFVEFFAKISCSEWKFYSLLRDVWKGSHKKGMKKRKKWKVCNFFTF